tara:strand:+ start:1255 stop:2424 length:1170 start_codon:yes stop_codon:yes gene_type:complete
MDYLRDRASNIQPIEEFNILAKKKNLRIKLGIDPTVPDVTLGWYAILRMLRKFQDYGHTAVLILGDFTAQVGDPSGKSSTRNTIESESVNENSKKVLKQVKKILNKKNLEIVSNNDWLGKLSISDMTKLASSTTLAQMLERDDFSKRYSSNSPISLIEFFYPLFQGYDSVSVKSDIEIGGTDQLWNLMIGREIQKYYGLSPQVAMTFPLLIGTDGKKKMSQSLNNYISITEPANDIYGKLMSLPDEAMWDYYKLLTDTPLKQIEEFKNEVGRNNINPFDLKKDLGLLIIEELFDKETAENASISFSEQTINKELPDDLPTIRLDGTDKVHIPKLLVDNNIVKSSSEARRLIASGSVKINSNIVEELDLEPSVIKNTVLQVGKRRNYRII